MKKSIPGKGSGKRRPYSFASWALLLALLLSLSACSSGGSSERGLEGLIACNDTDALAQTQEGSFISTGGIPDMNGLEGLKDIALLNEKVFYLTEDGSLWVYDGNEGHNLLFSGVTDFSISSYGWNGGGILAAGEDGRVVCSNFYDEEIVSEMESWEDIEAVCVGGSFAAGLHSDGTVTAAGDFWTGGDQTISWNELVKSWTDVVQLSGFDETLAGLRSDGTVLVAGNKLCGKDQAEAWTDIVKAEVGSVNIIGLRSDGTVVSTRDPEEYFSPSNGVLLYYEGQDMVSGWRNVKNIAAGALVSAALTEDGQLLSTYTAGP